MKLASIGADISFSLPTDGGYWGTDLDGDGFFNGMVGAVQNGTADFGVGNIFMKPFRTKAVDFSTVIGFDAICFLIKNPQPLPKFMAIILPFTT